MEHRGEIVENAIRKSGYSISRLAIKLGKSRRWMYLMFDNPNVSIEAVLKIGSIIHHDFTNEIVGLKNFAASKAARDPEEKYNPLDKTAVYWKEKYFQLLEEHHQLLKKIKEN